MQLRPLWGGLMDLSLELLSSSGRPCLDGFWSLRAHAATAAARRRRVATLSRYPGASAHRQRRRADVLPNIGPQAAYDTLWRDASGPRGAARPRAAFDSMRAASPRLGVDVDGFIRRRDSSTAFWVVLGETTSNCCRVCSCVESGYYGLSLSVGLLHEAAQVPSYKATHLLPSIPPLTLNGFCPVF